MEPVAGEEEELLGCFYPVSSYSTQNFLHFVFVVEFPLQDLFSSEFLHRVLKRIEIVGISIIFVFMSTLTRKNGHYTAERAVVRSVSSY